MFIHEIQKYRPRFDLWVRKFFWRRGWLPTPVFLPGESRGLRSLENNGPYGCKESIPTEAAEHTDTHADTSIALICK